jgi:hypothetical protein
MLQLSDDDGPWVPGFPDDHYAAWRDGGKVPPHAEKWNEALQLAVDWKTRDWPEREQGGFTLEHQVQISKRNPGWIDGYRIVIRP